MQIGKTVKRIAALGTGALMLGATLGGALAASTYKLADYPAPFIKSGVLDNTVFVVGKTAATSDVMGAIDLAAALQAEAVSKQAVSVGTSVAPSITDGVKIEKSGTKFLYGRDIVTVQSNALDENDLPVLLKADTFKDTEGENKGDQSYTQKLAFVSGAGQLILTQPEDMKGGTYLYFPKQALYNYTLTFDNSVSFGTATTDLEGNTIKLQGNTYTISEVHETSGGVLDRINMIAGDSTVWLVQDQPYTVGSHTVTVVDVAEASGGDTASCGVNVDGTTVWVDKDATEEIGGLNVGVLDVKAVHSKDYDQDTCELSLGSNELILEDGKNVKVNGVEIDKSTVDIMGTDGEWTGINIVFTSGKADTGVNSDKIYLADGGAWTDPVFGNWKIAYAGTTGDYENMKMETGSEEATFTYKNVDGEEVEIPWAKTGSTTMLGTATDEPLLLPGGSTTQDATSTKLLYTTSGGETHVLEISSLSCGNTGSNTTTIKDLTYGTTLANDKVLTGGCNNVAPIDIALGTLGTVNLVLDDSVVNYTDASGKGNGVPKSKYEGTFTFNQTAVTFKEKAGSEASASTIHVNLLYDTTDETVKTTLVAGDWATSAVNFDEGDDDTTWYQTAKGTIAKYDNADKLSVEIQAADGDVYGNVFVAPLKSEVSSGGAAGTVSADKVNPFAVGLAVLDEEADSMSKNMIVFGGPCVNTVAAGLLGNPTDCAQGFEAGKATLKFFDRNGKAALLVAGYDAQDSLNAAYVLAQHNGKYADQFKTLNDEVSLVVTDMSKVVFNTA